MRMLTPDLARFARMYLEDPDHLVWIWNTFVGVPLETGTACEVLNLGLRLAGRFQYDFVTYSKLAAEAGFDTVSVALQRKPVRGAARAGPAPDGRGREHVSRMHAENLMCSRRGAGPRFAHRVKCRMNSKRDSGICAVGPSRLRIPA